MPQEKIMADKKFKNSYKRKKSNEDDVVTELTAIADNLIEIVSHPLECSMFFIKHPDKGYVNVSEYKRNNKIYKPIPSDDLYYDVVSRDEIDKFIDETDKSLFNDVIDYLKQVSELPDDRLYLFLAAWVMHTYTLEHFDHTPILVFYGRAEQGKSRTIKGLSKISRRSYWASQLQKAPLFRISHNYEATVFLDVVDIIKQAKSQNCLDIILDKYERGKRIVRVKENGIAPLDLVFYNVFGCTAIATNDPIDGYIASRGISITMKTAKDLSKFKTFPSEGKLPQRLLAWRARWLNEKLPVVPHPGKGRFGDVLLPILSIISICEPSEMDRARSLFSDLYKKRQIDLSHSLEGELIEAMVHIRAIGGVNPKSVSGKGFHDVILHTQISEVINQERNSGYKIANKTITTNLKKMNFEVFRTSSNYACVIQNDDLLDELAQQFGIHIPSPDDPTLQDY